MTPENASSRPRLLCVYNADTGLIQALMHAVHKAVRPETYPCSLCALTYGAVSMRGDWKDFWKALDAKVDFYHRDDFTRDFPTLGTGGEREVALPVILISEVGEEPRVMIANEELDAMADVDELMECVGARLSLRAVNDDPVPSAA
ncbi:MAG: hypothetical protein AAFR32_00815 [Pseudomonadota bacterium]